MKGLKDNSQQEDPYTSYWAWDLEENNIIVRNGRASEFINDNPNDPNPYYLGDCLLEDGSPGPKCHIYGDMIYDEDNAILYLIILNLIME